jgi:type IV pilus assembly protein PilC
MGIKIGHISKKKEEKPKASMENILKKEINIFGNGFSNKKKEQFYSELSVLLKSGVNLKHSLDIIIESQSKDKDKTLLEKLNLAILEGSSFAAALQSEKSFTPYEYHAMRIGEQTGQLAFVTNDLAEYYKRRNEQKRQITSSLTYPVIVLFTAFLVVFFMLKYVVPMFEDIFEQNKVELPFLTRVIVKFSHLLEQNGLVFLLAIGALVIGVRFFRKRLWFRKFGGELILKLPVLGSYARKVYLTRFIHTMMLLTNSKIPVINGLSMVRKMVDFYPLQNSLKQVEAEILRGERMSISFSKHKIFDKKIIALLKVAEETNQTEFIFQRLYDQYSKDVEYQSQTITNVLNPLLTLMVGFIVGVILIAMYLPMFKLSSVIG